MSDHVPAIGPLVSGWSTRPRPPREAIQGRFVRLEPLDPPRHGPALHEANLLNADGSMWAYMPYGPFATLADWTAWAEPIARSEDPLFFAIVDRVTGVATGVAAYLAIAPEHGSIEVGHIAYSPRLQRTPAATEAMFLMMRAAFALGYRRYEWKCDALNGPSRAAAARLGLSFEGIFRQHRVVKGHNRDSAWFAAIDMEWAALRVAFEQWLDPANFDATGAQRVRLSDLTGPIRRGVPADR